MKAITMGLLKDLLKFKDRYEITIQFWPLQTVVFIEKDGIELNQFGGSDSYALSAAVTYLNRINEK